MLSFPLFSHRKAVPFQIRRVWNSHTHFIDESIVSVYSTQMLDFYSLSSWENGGLDLPVSLPSLTLFFMCQSPSSCSTPGLWEVKVIIPHGLRQCSSWNRRRDYSVPAKEEMKRSQCSQAVPALFFSASGCLTTSSSYSWDARKCHAWLLVFLTRVLFLLCSSWSFGNSILPSPGLWKL